MSDLFNNISTLAIIYVILNIISFSMFAIDKKKAVKHKWRISEASLIIASAFGIFGGFCGMYIMHHKTKKPLFYIGLPLIFILEIIITALIICEIVLH